MSVVASTDKYKSKTSIHTGLPRLSAIAMPRSVICYKQALRYLLLVIRAALVQQALKTFNIFSYARR
jgi:hypothetical protein